MRKTCASSIIHIRQFYKMLIFNLSACLSVKGGNRALVFSVKLSNANPVSAWIGERLTLPSTADFSCFFVFFVLFFSCLLTFFFFFFFFCRHFVTHSNNSVCMCSADAFS